VLNLYQRCLTPQSIAHTKPGGGVTNRKVIDSMDWNAVRAWLNRQATELTRSALLSVILGASRRRTVC
jgi:hypothetical protein